MNTISSSSLRNLRSGTDAIGNSIFSVMNFERYGQKLEIFFVVNMRLITIFYINQKH